MFNPIYDLGHIPEHWLNINVCRARNETSSEDVLFVSNHYAHKFYTEDLPENHTCQNL